MKICSCVALVITYCTACFFIKGECGPTARGDQMSKILERWKLIEREMTVISGRISKFNQRLTWQIYRRIDRVQDDLKEARRSLAEVSQKLSSSGKSAWLCVSQTQFSASGLNTTADKKWRKCLKAIIDEAATKEKTLSTLAAYLRSTALPCYYGMDCSHNGTIPDCSAKQKKPQAEPVVFGIGCRRYRWKDSYGCCNASNVISDMDVTFNKGRDLEIWMNKRVQNIDADVASCLGDIVQHKKKLARDKKILEMCKQKIS